MQPRSAVEFLCAPVAKMAHKTATTSSVTAAILLFLPPPPAAPAVTKKIK